MKKKNNLKLLLIASFFLIISKVQGQFICGPKFGFNSYSNTPGIGLQLGIVADEKFKVTADLMKYFSSYTFNHYIDPSTNYYNTNSSNKTVYEFNLNSSYILKVNKTYLYPVVGMNIITVERWDQSAIYPSIGTFQAISEVSTSYVKSKIGLNLGIGAQYNFGLLSPFVEAKYSISKFNNASIYAGVLFNIGRKKTGKEEKK